MKAEHVPLSHQLQGLLDQESATDRLTVNTLIEKTHGRGLYLAVILLSLVFIVPVSLPGVSTVLGVMIAILCFRLAFGLPPRLPRFLGDRPLPPAMRQRVLGGSVKFLRWVEKWVRPRQTRWLGRPAARTVNAVLMGLMACLLALPFPPLPPFTNSLPAYALILIAASTMEEDGYLVWVGYAVAIGTVIYLAFIAAALEKAVEGAIAWVKNLL